MTVARESALSEHLVSFCHALRDRGVPISTADEVAAARALATASPLDRDEVYYSLKVTLVADPDHAAVFDEAFDAWWGERTAEETVPEIDESGAPRSREEADDATGRDEAGGPTSADSTARNADSLADGVAETADAGGAERPTAPDRYDAERVGRQMGTRQGSVDPAVAFGDDDPDQDLPVLVRSLCRQLGVLDGFDSRPQSTGDLDLRRALNASRVRPPSSFPRTRPRRSAAKLRLFVDVSQSMLRNLDREFLLRFLFECVRRAVDARVFFFDTTITEVTDHFETVALDRTLAEMRRARTEWGAGTTIGRCLEAAFESDPFVVDNDSVVVVVSDGWDAGDLDRLAHQLARIRRRARTLVWLNPLATSDRYEPKVGGMATALPYLDRFYGFASVGDLRRITADRGGARIGR